MLFFLILFLKLSQQERLVKGAGGPVGRASGKKKKKARKKKKKRSTVAGSISRWICNEYISPGANFECRFSLRCWVRSPCASTAVGTLKIPNAGTIPQSGKYENTARTGSNGQWLIGTGAAYSLRPPEFPLKKLIKYYRNTTPLSLSLSPFLSPCLK